VRARATVDVGAVERNCLRIAAELPAETELCAVVKAGGYGHGAVPCAAAALAGGATWLAVAAASEAVEIRAELAERARLLVLGALDERDLDLALGAGADVPVWRPRFLELVSARGRALGIRPRVHVKFDTGMGRLGERDPAVVADLTRTAAAADDVELVGFWTHFATADEGDSTYLDAQLDRFLAVGAPLREEIDGLMLHAANSAATLREPRAHLDMVRCGIAIYGLDPYGRDPAEQRLEPALTLSSYVADVKSFESGASAGYGRSWTAERDTHVGVLPIGYGDGVRRGLSNNAEVLIRGRRYPVVGTISMDNLTVDLGSDPTVEPGDEAVLIGPQGDDRILCEEVAARLGTINYEVTCAISSRVPREAV